MASLGAVGAYFFWRQVTAVPEWYVKSNVPLNLESSSPIKPVEKPPKLADVSTAESPPEEVKVITRESPFLDTEEGNTQQETVTLSTAKLNEVINAKLADSPRTQPFLEAIQGVQSNLEQEKLEIGTVIQPSLISREALGSSEQVLLERAMGSFPGLSKQRVYVGIEGDVQVNAEGAIDFDETTKVRIGNLQFSLKEVAQRLGIPPEILQEELQIQLENLERGEN